MTDLDALPFDYPEEAPHTRHRHAWMVEQQTGHKFCHLCGVHWDEERVRRGRNNRARGNSIEREIGHRLGLRRVGQYGDKDDLSDALFRAQVKSGGAFSERYWAWLRAVPATNGQTRLLVVTDAPGPGHKRRAFVLLEIEDWAALHGSVVP